MSVPAIAAVTEAITRPLRLWTRDEVLSSPSPVPLIAGVYGWFFRDLPYPIDVRSCVVAHGSTLLYVGIAPRQSSPPGGQTLRKRLSTHYRGSGEVALSQWMGENALVVWYPVAAPWTLELLLVRTLISRSTLQ